MNKSRALACAVINSLE